MGNATSNATIPSSNPKEEDVEASIRLSVRSPALKTRISSGRGKSVTIADDRGYYIQPLKDSDESSNWRETNGSKKRQNHRNDLYTASPVSSEGSSKVVSIPSLHGSLLKVHQKRDPLRYYEVVKVLGDGSMGSVSKVIKRQSAKGGSARKNFVRREKQHEWCFGIFDPDNCGKFNIFCPIKDEDDHESFASDLETPEKSSLKSTDSVSSGGDEHHQGRDGGKKLTGEARAKLFAKHKTSSLITYDIKDSFYALKSIHLDQCRDDVFRLELLNEISILQRLDHPHIVKALETFNFKDRLYVVLELCSGGDLYTRDPYTETQACSIIHDILDAVAYMHSRGITHRDLKFENIMFSSPDLDAVKVIDFGLSKKYSQKEHLHDTVGTVYTMAPEVLRGDYDQKCDVWSMGVISFMLLSSSLPFYGKTRQHVARMVLGGKFAFKGHRWKSISMEAKDFVLDCLVTKASKRKSAQDMMRHAFILAHADVHRKGSVGFALIDRVQATIQTYCDYEKMKKLGLLVIAHKSTDSEIGWLRNVFNIFDVDLDSEITLPDFKAALKPYHYTEEDMERMFIAMDLDGTGKVHYSEFLAGTLEAHGSISEERIAEAFDRLDSDATGYITKKNIMDFLGDAVSEDYANAIIDEADIYHDHRITYEEFLALWNETNDEKFKEALQDVNHRRVSFDDASIEDLTDGESIRTETSAESPSQESYMAIQSADTIDLGGGSFFFGVEKEKSMRGVWV